MKLTDAFTAQKTILCLCPCCGEIRRLSDLHITYKGSAPKTWLDTYEEKIRSLEKREEKFDEHEEEIREKSRERGRKKAVKMITGSLDAGIAKMGYDPYDIKTILHPVDFIAFDGMNGEEMRSIDLLCRKAENSLLKLQKDVEEAVKKEKYEWRTARIRLDGKIGWE